MCLHETIWARDDHRADGIRAHDVGIVVDLDPPQIVFDAERSGERREQLFLARAIRQFAAERFACVLRGVIDKVFLFARCGTATSIRCPARSQSARSSKSRSSISCESRMSRAAGLSA